MNGTTHQPRRGQPEQPIELAPDHKVGLPIANPVLLAAGSIGYGEAKHKELDTARFGAVVVGPFTRRSRSGGGPPRTAETVAGFVRNAGLQNRGASAAVRRFSRLWPRLGCPVIAQIADGSREEAEATIRRLEAADGIQGLELLCRREAGAEDIVSLLELFQLETDLPVLAKLPLERAAELAPVAVSAGANGVVVANPPIGAAFRPDGQVVTGETFGLGVFPAMLAALLAVKALGLPGSLVASGGIHTMKQARECLAAGADALQLESLVWIEPGAALAIATEFTRVPFPASRAQ